MRIDSLTNKELPADSILKEIGVPKDERQVIMEFLPLIPVALWAGGAAWTAYDTYQAKKAYDRGEITQAELAKRVGTDVAIGIAGGVLGKAVGAGWKVGKRIFRNKKAAQAAQKQTADIPTPKEVTPPTGINAVSNAATDTAKSTSKKTVQTANPGDTIKTSKGEFIAGVDGKATTTRVNAPNAKEIKNQILKIANPDSSTTASVVNKVDDVTSTVATQTTKAADDAAEIAAKKADAIAGGPDYARNYVKNRALNQMSDLPPEGQKAFIKSIERAHPGIAKELGVDKLIAPAVSQADNVATKVANKVDDVAAPVASTGSNVATKTSTQTLTKTQRDAISKMDQPKTSTSTATATGSATSTAAKQADDAAAAAGKRTDNPNVNKGNKKSRTKLGRFMSNLRRGNYWDTDMVGAVKRYQNFQG